MLEGKTLHLIPSIGDWLIGLLFVEGLKGAWFTASSEWKSSLVMMLLPWVPSGALAVLPATSEEVRKGKTAMGFKSSTG